MHKGLPTSLSLARAGSDTPAVGTLKVTVSCNSTFGVEDTAESHLR